MKTISRKINAEYTYSYQGKNIKSKHAFSIVRIHKFPIGSRHYKIFVPEVQSVLMDDTLPSWYTLDAPDEGWKRIPFECELRRMMNLGYPTPVKAIGNRDKTWKPQKRGYSFATSRHAMQPFLNDLFKCVIVEEVPAKIYDYGDVVVFRRPEGGTSMSRIVGLPGDRIATEDYLCIINGQKTRTEVLPEEGTYMIENPKDHYKLSMQVVDEKFPNGVTARIYRYGTENPPEKSKSSIEPQIVPEGHFFLLSDSRPFAKDSRYTGPVAASNIKGVVVDIADDCY